MKMSAQKIKQCLKMEDPVPKFEGSDKDCKFTSKQIYKTILFQFLFIILFTWILKDSIFAEKSYSPPAGSPERKAIVDTLREGLKSGQEPDRSEFQYESIPEDVRVVFLVDYLKVMNHWAWVEARGKNYNVHIYALLFKKDKNWTLKGMIDPQIFSCTDPQECIDINNSIYKKFKEIFPSVPVEIFPKEHPECKAILNALRESIKTVPQESVNFVVRYLKVINEWAWIETDPRGSKPIQGFESIDALLHKEKGKWQIKNFKPCCGDCEDDPYCAKGIYHKKLMQMFPSVPKEIFPNKTR